MSALVATLKERDRARDTSGIVHSYVSLVRSTGLHRLEGSEVLCQLFTMERYGTNRGTICSFDGPFVSYAMRCGCHVGSGDALYRRRLDQRDAHRKLNVLLHHHRVPATPLWVL